MTFGILTADIHGYDVSEKKPASMIHDLRPTILKIEALRVSEK
jgi:hypothetical protein